MILEFIIFAIPLPLYLNAEANKRSRKRVRVLGLFLLGSLVLMLSAWRLIALVCSRAGTYPTFDLTWAAPGPMALSSRSTWPPSAHPSPSSGPCYKTAWA
ncbi:uncharacterized protein LY79DRAFT_573342 [Colletotrichum navitas]|uniref:Uncharacterized protein n=1 Tax=Colletotrichum navitas TaxID=681940 RepID=A0AAD8PK75_9PEZI|nr:uncharacterized protein LY79DRAFT_573342 [Colletotrichum navitas]KAK1564271.1 hypothetical protein LY79DRAFT_573342 [Colletotrichum navitas]